MLDVNALKHDPQWSSVLELAENTWAPYEGKLDVSDWPDEWIKQVPKDVREGKEHQGIESIWLTK